MIAKLHKAQLQIANDEHRFKVIAAGRRFGKSTLAQVITLKWALEGIGLYWIISPTYKQSKTIHWRDLQRVIPKEWIDKKNEVELSITLHNGSIIELKGAENPDALRGVKLRGLVIDEIASIRNWEWLWKEALRPTLTDYEAPAIFISTPKGMNHFHALYELGTTEGEYKSWRFTTLDNPYISAKEVEKARLEMDEQTFLQEYMSEFTSTSGLAVKQWKRAINLIPYFEVPKEWQRIRGFDYGSNDPTASVRIAIHNNDWFIERCYKDSQRTIEDHANVIKAQDYGQAFIPMWGDPSGAQWFTEFEKYGVHIQPANKEIGQGMRGWVEHGIEKINQLLKPKQGHQLFLNGQEYKDAPNMFVLDTPENRELVKEIEILPWRETANGVTIPVLDENVDPNGHCDLMAALRYAVVSYETIQRNIPQPQEDWSLDYV